MKKILLSLLFVLAVCGIANADETVINTADVTWTASETSLSGSSNGFDFSILKATGGTKPAFNATSKDVRAYAKNTVEITSGSANMTSVVFSLSAQGQKQLGDITASAGSVVIDTESWTVTWTGSAQSVMFTVGATNTHGTNTAKAAGQLCFDAVTITSGSASGVAAPKASVAAGTYYSAQSVELTCATADAKIYYTLDGTTPTSASTEYTSAIAIDKTSTLKAIAVAGDKTSSVLTVDYVISAMKQVANIAEFLALDDNEVVAFANPVTAVFQGTSLATGTKPNHLYVQDATGAMLVYGNLDQVYANGDVIPAGFYGTKTTYSGLVEFSTKVGTDYSTDSFLAPTSKEAEVQPTIHTIGEISGVNQNQYVKFLNVTFDATAKTLADDEDVIAVYNRFLKDITLPESGTYASVVGLASIYTNSTSSTIQIFPVAFNKTDAVEGVEANTAKVIAVNGEINVIGAAKTIAVYNAGGALVSKNQANVNVAAGLYIVTVDGKATKVIVK